MSKINRTAQQSCGKRVIFLSLVGLFFLQTTNSFLMTNPRPSATLPLLYSSSDEEQSAAATTKFQKNGRWSSLSPSVKARIVNEAQQRAIRNKAKREPIAEKKRKLLMKYKDAQRRNKRASRVSRPFPTNSVYRTKLSDLVVDSDSNEDSDQEVYNGTVISLTDFGAYVDIGSECDGLLHVSQITREEFIEHPRQVLSPGMEVDVRILRCSPELKKMHLTMLPKEVVQSESRDKSEGEAGERIALQNLDLDDELWGEIRRVTAYGAYVEVGAVVDGWLHFMDHPLFGNVKGARPGEYMEVGQRIRCWVSGVDIDMKRLKLTANRPEDLPGPRRELRKRAEDDNDDDEDY